MKSGSLDLLEPSGPHRACYGTPLPFMFTMGRCRHVSPLFTGLLASVDVVVMVIVLVLEEVREDGMAAVKIEEHASCKRNKMPHK